MSKKYRKQGGHLYEFMPKHNAFVHVYYDARIKTLPALIAAYERDSEPDLGQMFDMAYEDQCRDACGL